MTNYIDPEAPPPIDEIDRACPNTLIKRGNVFLLFNTKLPEKEGENPIIFQSLDGYIQHLEEQKTKGIHCPVLFLQQENDLQGKDVFRMRPSPFLMDGGLNPVPMFDIDKMTPVKMVDAGIEDPPYNQNQYNAFDPTSQYVGEITNVDLIHYSTETNTGKASENPMDPNWGGIIYTQAALQSGKYDDNSVYKVMYPNLAPK